MLRYRIEDDEQIYYFYILNGNNQFKICLEFL